MAQQALRVSFTLSSLWLSGGVMLVIEMANRLAARGHVVALVAPGNATDPLMAGMIASNVRVICSPVGRQPGEGRLHHARLALSLAKALPASDVILSTHTPTTVPTALAGIWQPRSARFWLFMDTSEMFAKGTLERWLFAHAMRWHSGALCISKATAGELRSAAPEIVKVVGMGLSHETLLTPRYIDERSRNEPPVLLYVGDDRPRKGLADFLAAAEILAAQGRALRLEIVSRTPCKVACSLPHRTQIAPPPEELAELLKSCDCYVMASWMEGLGNVPLEAMACATPVVLTDAGGPGEYARHEENCLVVPPRNPQSIAAAIARILDERNLARRLSVAGPATADQNRWSPVIDRVERLLFRSVQLRNAPMPRPPAAGAR